jgi:hypothetical protein
MATLKEAEIDMAPEEIDRRLRLISEYQQVVQSAQESIKELIKGIDAAVIDSVREGQIVIKGETSEGLLTRRVNVSYPKPRGEQSMLETLCEEVPEVMLPMVRVEFKESGKKIEKFIEQFPDLSLDDDPTQMVREQLIAFRLLQGRKVTAGAPSLKVVSVGDDNEVIEI